MIEAFFVLITEPHWPNWRSCCLCTRPC